MATVSQLPASLNYNGVAGNPATFAVTFTLTTSGGGSLPWSSVTGYEVEIADQFGTIVQGVTPTLTSPAPYQLNIGWTATQTAIISEAQQPRMALSIYVSGLGPYAVLSGNIVMSPPEYPGASSTPSATAVVQVGTVAVNLALSTGLQGPQGYQGSTGSQGSIGPQGYQGSVGAQGFQGSVGAQGYQGSVGTTGILVASVAPTNTTILWADTTDPGNEAIPPGGSAGQILTKTSSANYDTGWTSGSVIATQYQTQTFSYYTAGAYSGTIPSWANVAEVCIVAGGGGGGGGAVSTTGFGGAGGGAAGTVIVRVLPVTPSASYSGSVGAGGSGGSASVSGTRGGTSSLVTTGAFGTSITALGGSQGYLGSPLIGAGAGGAYGLLINSSSNLGPGSGAPSSTATTANAVGPVSGGAGGGAAGYPQSTTVGGQGGQGGSTTSGALALGASASINGTAGGAGESSSVTSPGGGGGGGGGAAYTGGTPGAGGSGGTGSVTITFRSQ